ncbi:MAG: ABC transporter ATP-binding protein [bacterium]|nr:ABC transporter ATP-binding protein [bacterium]
MKAWLGRDHNPYIDGVCGVSFNLEEGRTFALVGESGAGKTTLARSIIGLIRPQEGRIKFRGKELTGLSDSGYKKYRKDIAMMFQDPVGCLSPRITVKSLITEPFKIHSIRQRDLDREAERLLDMVGLPRSFAGNYPHQLSGGQARRVGVARALALSPKLIVADEPTAGLDVSVQGEILNLLAGLQEKLSVSLLIITHNLAVVRHISDRMGIMYLGRFVEKGYTDEIFAHPRHPYTHAMLSAHPNPDPDNQKERVELKGEVPSLIHRPTGCEFHTRCPFMQDHCRTEFPAATAAGERHVFHCHHPLELNQLQDLKYGN